MAMMVPLTLLAPLPWLAYAAVWEKEVGLLHMQRVGGVSPAAQVSSHLCAGSALMMVLLLSFWVGAAILELGFAEALPPLWTRTSPPLLMVVLLSWSVIVASMGSIVASLVPTRRALSRLGWFLVLGSWVAGVVICTSLFGTPTPLFGHADLGPTLPPGMCCMCVGM